MAGDVCVDEASVIGETRCIICVPDRSSAIESPDTGGVFSCCTECVLARRNGDSNTVLSPFAVIVSTTARGSGGTGGTDSRSSGNVTASPLLPRLSPQRGEFKYGFSPWGNVAESWRVIPR